MPIKVGIVEKARDSRDGLRMLLDGTFGYECAGAWTSMEQALLELGSLGMGSKLPQVLLADLSRSRTTAFAGIQYICEHYPAVAVIAHAARDDDESLEKAICAGASGYLVKPTAPTRLLAAIDEAAQGGAPLSPQVSRRVLELVREARPHEGRAPRLTPYELRVIRLLAEGHNYGSAARELAVTVHATSFHMRNIYRKLGVHSKSEAVARALRTGIIR